VVTAFSLDSYIGHHYSSPMPKKHSLSRHFIALQAETRKHNEKRGLYTQVARRLGLTPAHVRNVAMGLRRSSRVEAALDAALRRLAA
jgi:hypothetical protein